MSIAKSLSLCHQMNLYFLILRNLCLWHSIESLSIVYHTFVAGLSTSLSNPFTICSEDSRKLRWQMCDRLWCVCHTCIDSKIKRLYVDFDRCDRLCVQTQIFLYRWHRIVLWCTPKTLWLTIFPDRADFDPLENDKLLNLNCCQEDNAVLDAPRGSGTVLQAAGSGEWT